MRHEDLELRYVAHKARFNVYHDGEVVGLIDDSFERVLAPPLHLRHGGQWRDVGGLVEALDSIMASVNAESAKDPGGCSIEEPEIMVRIAYDRPTDPYWLNPDNVALALAAYCPNTRFRVRWSPGGDPWSDIPPRSCLKCRHMRCQELDYEPTILECEKGHWSNPDHRDTLGEYCQTAQQCLDWSPADEALVNSDEAEPSSRDEMGFVEIAGHSIHPEDVVRLVRHEGPTIFGVGVVLNSGDSFVVYVSEGENVEELHNKIARKLGWGEGLDSVPFDLNEVEVYLDRREGRGCWWRAYRTQGWELAGGAWVNPSSRWREIREARDRSGPREPCDVDRCADPDTIFQQLGGSVLPLATSPTGKRGEPVDTVTLISHIEGATGLPDGLPVNIGVVRYDYRQPREGTDEWPREIRMTYFASTEDAVLLAAFRQALERIAEALGLSGMRGVLTNAPEAVEEIRKTVSEAGIGGLFSLNQAVLELVKLYQQRGERIGKVSEIGAQLGLSGEDQRDVDAILAEIESRGRVHAKAMDAWEKCSKEFDRYKRVAERCWELETETGRMRASAETWSKMAGAAYDDLRRIAKALGLDTEPDADADAIVQVIEERSQKRQVKDEAAAGSARVWSSPDGGTLHIEADGNVGASQCADPATIFGQALNRIADALGLPGSPSLITTVPECVEGLVKVRDDIREILRAADIEGDSITEAVSNLVECRGEAHDQLDKLEKDCNAYALELGRCLRQKEVSRDDLRRIANVLGVDPDAIVQAIEERSQKDRDLIGRMIADIGGEPLDREACETVCKFLARFKAGCVAGCVESEEHRDDQAIEDRSQKNQRVGAKSSIRTLAARLDDLVRTKEQARAVLVGCASSDYVNAQWEGPSPSFWFDVCRQLNHEMRQEILRLALQVPEISWDSDEIIYGIAWDEDGQVLGIAAWTKDDAPRWGDWTLGAGRSFYSSQKVVTTGEQSFDEMARSIISRCECLARSRFEGRAWESETETAQRVYREVEEGRDMHGLEFDATDPDVISDPDVLKAGVTREAALRWITKWCEPARKYARMGLCDVPDPVDIEEVRDELDDLEYHVDRLDVPPPEISCRLVRMPIDEELKPSRDTELQPSRDTWMMSWGAEDYSDAKISGWGGDLSRNVVVLLLESERFGEVCSGDVIIETGIMPWGDKRKSLPGGT